VIESIALFDRAGFELGAGNLDSAVIDARAQRQTLSVPALTRDLCRIKIGLHTAR